ncbi:MAG: hypothetical protein MJZ34_12585 [Paludibacteraceae bacterium]|nr:hypothetical protein [Paludibacteraceae bacterium]
MWLAKGLVSKIFDGDTIIGRNHKDAIQTINERLSGYLWMIKETDSLAEGTSWYYLLIRISTHYDG